MLLRFPENAGIGREGLWAKPVDANEGGGTYELMNNAFYAPLRIQDIVRAELDARSCLQVVEIVRLANGPVSFVEVPDGVALELVKALGDRWAKSGAMYTEGTTGALVTAWPASMAVSMVERVLRLTTPANWRVLEVADAHDRAAALPDLVDLELDQEAPEDPGTVDYWAADDPGWAGLGVTDAARLAYLQGLAADDPRVLATIRAGRHDDVMRYVERLMAPDPRDLPPLGRPLLIDPDGAADGSRDRGDGGCADGCAACGCGSAPLPPAIVRASHFTTSRGRQRRRRR